MSGSVLSSFAFSALMNKKKKFVMEHVQNATLAGGVAIGACADLMIQPHFAFMAGSVCGVVSTLGYKVLQVYILRYDISMTWNISMSRKIKFK